MATQTTKQKRDTQHKNWILTIAEHLFSRDELTAKLGRYRYCGQLEVGKDGYRHYQVGVFGKSGIRFSTLKNLLPGAHLEPAENAYAVLEYVTKERTAVEGGEIGNCDPAKLKDELKGKGTKKAKDFSFRELHEKVLAGEKVSDLVLVSANALRFRNALSELELLRIDRQNSTIREVEAIYIHGATGVGKTYSVFTKCPDLYRVTSYKNPWDLYRQQKTVALEEFASDLPITELLQVVDKYPMQVRARYADRHRAWDRVIIISNLPFEEQYKDIQKTHPEQFRALSRRFGYGKNVYELCEGGVWKSGGEVVECPL